MCFQGRPKAGAAGSLHTGAWLGGAQKLVPGLAQKSDLTRATPVEALYSSPFSDFEDPSSLQAQLRKSRSMDTSVIDLAEATNPNNIMSNLGPNQTLVRSAKSDFNLCLSSQNGMNGGMDDDQRQTPADDSVDDGRREVVRAVYSYLASGDHQLSFVEGDIVSLIGEKNKGWQFGENLRTGRTGWFPLAYTEQMVGPEETNGPQVKLVNGSALSGSTVAVNGQGGNFGPTTTSTAKPRPVTMFGDTLLYRLPGKAKVL
ncbi:unnamed protein product [Notodromas monacha]|uniref:SH3 domain-containing protein n=1 Tax=Notodromas monacha TaxID=399045 RepID=A0A7R9BYT6_9CRUS|nr:unnamed protein product [Notodromas monacha]CAG0924243.1 unnamed protein product [Notodromas monacha]